MAQRKESFFWTSYSDLMTSLFFIMLVLFVLVIVLLHKRMQLTEKQLEQIEELESWRTRAEAAEWQLIAIKKIEGSTKNLSKEYFTYRPEYKKYVLNIMVTYPRGESDITNIAAEDKEECLNRLYQAGMEVQSFLQKNNEYKYILIIEGQASKDTYNQNYELSYKRALGLIRYWDSKGLDFGDNCEIQISGSGDGTIKTNSMREIEETSNQRFLIHILPKNILNNEESE